MFPRKGLGAMWMPRQLIESVCHVGTGSGDMPTRVYVLETCRVVEAHVKRGQVSSMSCQRKKRGHYWSSTSKPEEVESH
jgi:hypothetical protein